MVAIPKITQAELKTLVEYDPSTGVFTWLVTHPKRVTVKGQVAGFVDKQSGYACVKIHSKRYRQHILAYLYMTGTYPPDRMVIDHEDHNKLNNAWSNLRCVTQAENSRNVSATRRSRTGHQGVRQRGFKYIAYIKVQGKIQHLGTFGSASEAVCARKGHLAKLGFHENHGDES